MTKQNRLPLALRLFASPPGDRQLSLWNPLIFTCFLSDPDFTQKVCQCECLKGLLFCGFMWAMVNTHYMVDGHPIHNKDPYNGYYKSLWTIGWLAPINGY